MRLVRRHKILFSLIFGLIFGLMAFSLSPSKVHAFGCCWGYGYFFGGYQNTGDFVLSCGINPGDNPGYGVANFVNDIGDYYFGGSDVSVNGAWDPGCGRGAPNDGAHQNQIGAAFTIWVMMQYQPANPGPAEWVWGPGGQPPTWSGSYGWITQGPASSAYDYDYCAGCAFHGAWVAKIIALANAGRANFNYGYCYTSNSLYSAADGDVHDYPTSSTCVNSVAFLDQNLQPNDVIKHSCGNQVFFLQGTPSNPPVWISGIIIVNNGGSISPVSQALNIHVCVINSSTNPSGYINQGSNGIFSFYGNDGDWFCIEPPPPGQGGVPGSWSGPYVIPDPGGSYPCQGASPNAYEFQHAGDPTVGIGGPGCNRGMDTGYNFEYFNTPSLGCNGISTSPTAVVANQSFNLTTAYIQNTPGVTYNGSITLNYITGPGGESGLAIPASQSASANYPGGSNTWSPIFLSQPGPYTVNYSLSQGNSTSAINCTNSFSVGNQPFISVCGGDTMAGSGIGNNGVPDQGAGLLGLNNYTAPNTSGSVPLGPTHPASITDPASSSQIDVFGDGANGDLIEYITDGAASSSTRVDVTSIANNSTGTTDNLITGRAVDPIVSQNNVLIVFAASSQQHLLEYARNGNSNTTWNVYDLSALTGSTGNIISYNITSGLDYTQAANDIHVYTVDSGGNLVEFWSTNPDASAPTWHFANASSQMSTWSTNGGSTPALPFVSRPSLIWWSAAVGGSNQFLMYLEANNGHLIQVVHFDNSSPNFVGYDMNSYGGTPPIGGPPTAVLDSTVDSVLHVFYPVYNGSTYDLYDTFYYFSASPTGWLTYDLTSHGNAPTIQNQVIGTNYSPNLDTASGGYLQIFVDSANSHLFMISRGASDQAQWVKTDVSSITGGQIGYGLYAGGATTPALSNGIYNSGTNTISAFALNQVAAPTNLDLMDFVLSAPNPSLNTVGSNAWSVHDLSITSVSTANNFGAGGNLAAFAADVINDYVSSNNSPNCPATNFNSSSSPESLSFGNNNQVTSNPACVPNSPWGGCFTSAYNAPDYYSWGQTNYPTQISVGSPYSIDPTNTTTLGTTLGCPSLTDSSGVTTYYCNLKTTSNQLALAGIGGGTVNMPLNTRVVIFMSGDVLINSNLCIAGNMGGSGVSCAAGSYTAKTIPGLYVIASGNIWINSNVHYISGVFEAETNSSASFGGGEIGTCTNGFSFVPANNLYASACNSQLTVDGSVIAGKSIRFERVAGSIQNNQPAETFTYNPMFWLVNPFNTQSSLPGTPTYNTITDLPPVL